jgi:hypothetical protein
LKDTYCQFRFLATPKAVCCGALERVMQRIGYVGQEWAESAFQCQGKLSTCVQGGGHMHAPQQPWRVCPDRPPVERRTGGCLGLRLCWHIEHSTETAGCDSGGTVTKRQWGEWPHATTPSYSTTVELNCGASHNASDNTHTHAPSLNQHTSHTTLSLISTPWPC